MIREGRLTNYPDLERFCADPASGVDREAEFWRAFSRRGG
jgi:hypothetical protein